MNENSNDLSELEQYYRKVELECTSRSKKLDTIERELQDLHERLKKDFSGHKYRRGDATMVVIAASQRAALEQTIAKKNSERDEAQRALLRARERLEEVQSELRDLGWEAEGDS